MILLILILVSILRTALNIAFRAIAVARARSCGWWLTGTLWGLLLQGVVAPVQWTMAKRCAISGAAGQDKEDRGGSTPAGTRLLIRSSSDRGSVLLHLDQHFIERGPYRSGRERTLEIEGRGLYATCVIYPMCCVSINSAPGLYNQLSLLPSEPRTRARVERVGSIPLNWPLDLEGKGLSARDCLRDSQTICSF